jgi:hypothetical protein
MKYDVLDEGRIPHVAAGGVSKWGKEAKSLIKHDEVAEAHQVCNVYREWGKCEDNDVPRALYVCKSIYRSSQVHVDSAIERG